MYYLQSRYYDPNIGRWLNSDIPSIIGLLFISNNVLDPNLFLFCSNQPIDDVDITGCISANKIASMFSISAIFSMFMLTLCVSYSKGKEEIDNARKKIPNRLMKNGKVDLSKFNNPKGPKGPRATVEF